MISRMTTLFLGGMVTLAALGGPEPAAALTMQQCSAKYKAAQDAGALSGMTWQQFRKANCGPGASPLHPPGSGTPAGPRSRNDPSRPAASPFQSWSSL